MNRGRFNLLALGTEYTLSYKDGLTSFKLERSGNRFTVTQVTLGLPSTIEYTVDRVGIFDIKRNRPVVESIDGGYSRRIYANIGSAFVTQSVVKQGNSVRYRIDKGLDLHGETTFTHTSSGVDASVGWLRRHITVSIRQQPGMMRVTWGDREIRIFRNPDTITILDRDNYGVLVKLLGNKVTMDHVWRSSPFERLLGQGKKRLEVEVNKQE